MQEEIINSWEEFEHRVVDLIEFWKKKKSSTPLYVSNILFRGQSDARWGLQTTLERYIGLKPTLYGYYRVIHAAKSRVETFTERKWEKIPTPPEYESWLAKYEPLAGGKFPAYEYMVYLRHHGFPSPLLDWTTSPYVAAYFAFREIEGKADSAAIFAYIEYMGQGKSAKASEPIICSLGPYISSHKRHFLQQCEYTICTRVENKEAYYSSHDMVFTRDDQNQDLLWKFILPSSERMKVLKKLDMYNINAHSLFGSEESLMETLALREFFLRKMDL